VISLAITRPTYQPTWDSLDARPLPSWYDESKFGIFIHWGLFSVPSYGCNGGGASGEWYWWVLRGEKNPCLVEWHTKTYGEDFKYEDFATMWKTPIFDPDSWAELFEDSGAKYVVLTSKHHEGFANWPSNNSWNWNSWDNGPHQDNVAMVTNAVRKRGLHMGLYHSLFEWFNPLYLTDRSNNGTTSFYTDTVLHPQLHDIVNSYLPELIWSDGDWEMNDTYWRSQEFLAWLYNESPVRDTVVVNDRWGNGDSCLHGGYYTCDDRYNPGVLQPHKWENALTIDRNSWGFRRNADINDMLSIEELLFQLASTVACGGNMLLNVGPTSEGTIIPVFEERLRQIGAWLKVNGESIYSSVPWRAQNDTAADTWYTKSRKGDVYAIVLSWPSDSVVRLTEPVLTSSTTMVMVGLEDYDLKFSRQGGYVNIELPDVPFTHLPNPYAWVIKMTNVA